MRRHPVALFTLETSNSRNVHPVSVTFRLFDFSTIRRIGGKTFRRQHVSAAKRFGGKTFRRQNVSAATFFAVSSVRCDRIGPIIRCDARFGDSAAYPRRRIAETARKVRKGRQKPDLCKIGTSTAFHVEQLKMFHVEQLKMFHVERLQSIDFQQLNTL